MKDYNIKEYFRGSLRKSITGLLIVCILMPLALIAFLLFFSLNSHAMSSGQENVLSAHTSHDFDTTLKLIKQQLAEKGFQVAHVQRCDNGLKKMGYEVNKYQVVFFGRLDEVREITTKYTELTPFLPFKLLIYVQGNDTVMSIMNPEILTPMVTDKALTAKFAQWKREFVDILEKVSETSL